MRTFLLALLLAFITPLQANAQDKSDWKKEIEGSWKINYPKTTELPLQGPQKEYARDLAMIPIASPVIRFNDKTIIFQGVEPQDYLFV